MFNRKNRMAALMSMAKTPVLSQEDNADAPQPASEPAQKDVVEAPLTNDKGLETEKSTDGSGETMAPGQDTEETKRTDVGSGAKELAPEAELTSPTEKQPDFDVKAPVLNPAADPNNPNGGDTKPQVAEPAANVGDADKSETQTENTDGGEKVGEDANKPKNAEGTVSGKPGAAGEPEGKVSEESEAAEIAAAAIDAYEKGVARGEGNVAAGGEAPAEQITPEAAAEQAAATVAQAAADAAQASAADIAAGGTGEVGVGGEAAAEASVADAIDGAAAADAAVDGALDGAAAAGDLPADTTGAAEDALDDAAGGVDDIPADGSTEGVSGDDATTAGESDAANEGGEGEGESEGEPTQTSETEGDSTSDIETEEAKKKAEAEDEALDDLDDLEDEEELALEQYNIAGDMLAGIRMLAQESYQSEHGGLTPDVMRALNIALEGAQRIGSIRVSEGLSLEALDYRLPAHITDDLMYSIEEMEEQLTDNMQLSQESLLDIFRSRNTIIKNFCEDAGKRISNLKGKLKGKTGTVSIRCGFKGGLVEGLKAYVEGAQGALDSVGKNAKVIKNMGDVIDKMRKGEVDYKVVVSRLEGETVDAPKFNSKPLVMFNGSQIVSYDEEDYTEYDKVKAAEEQRDVDFDLGNSGSLLSQLEASLKLLRSMNGDLTRTEAAFNKVDSGTNSTGKQTAADAAVRMTTGAVSGALITGLVPMLAILPVTVATLGMIGTWGWFLSKRQNFKFAESKRANLVLGQFDAFSDLVKLLQDGLKDNIDRTLRALEKQ